YHVLKIVSDAQYFNVNTVSLLQSGGTITGTSTGTDTGTTTGGSTSSTCTTTSTGGIVGSVVGALTCTGGTGGTTTDTSTGGTTTGGTTTGGTTTGGSSTGAKPASMLFWSGFEGGTTVATPTDCYPNGCWEDVTGTDN